MVHATSKGEAARLRRRSLLPARKLRRLHGPLWSYSARPIKHVLGIVTVQCSSGLKIKYDFLEYNISHGPYPFS